MTLKLAMIGTGGIADKQLAPALTKVEGGVLWSVLSRAVERGVAFAERHGAQSPDPVHVGLETLVADPALDAVIIASPDKLHAEQTISAARAGKHVLVEKPMATEVADAIAMAAACKTADVRLAVAYHNRWHNGLRQLVEQIRTGLVGELRHMRVQWSWKAGDAGNWRASSNVGRWWGLGGVGTHCLDAIRWVMLPTCGEVVSLKSHIGRSVWQAEHDESALVSMQFESGATAVLHSSVLFESDTRLEIWGSDGHVVGDAVLGAEGSGTLTTHAGVHHFEVKNPYVGEISDFVRAISTGAEPEVGGKEGARNVELLVEAVGGG